LPAWSPSASTHPRPLDRSSGLGRGRGRRVILSLHLSPRAGGGRTKVRPPPPGDMSMRNGTPAFWIAQGWIVLTLVGLACLARRPSVDPPPPVPSPVKRRAPSEPAKVEKPSAPVREPVEERAYSADQYPSTQQARYLEVSYELWELEPRELRWMLGHQHQI